MGYATPSDFAIFGLPAPATALPTVNAAFIQAHLDAWSGKVDQVVNMRGASPIPGPPYPPLVVMWVCWGAAHSILTAIGYKPTNRGDTAVKDRHDMVVKELKAIEDGRNPPWVASSSATYATSDAPRGWVDPSRSGDIT